MGLILFSPPRPVRIPIRAVRDTTSFGGALPRRFGEAIQFHVADTLSRAGGERLSDGSLNLLSDSRRTGCRTPGGQTVSRYLVEFAGKNRIHVRNKVDLPGKWGAPIMELRVRYGFRMLAGVRIHLFIRK